MKEIPSRKVVFLKIKVHQIKDCIFLCSYNRLEIDLNPYQFEGWSTVETLKGDTRMWYASKDIKTSFIL